MDKESIQFRPATRSDVGLILKFIKAFGPHMKKMSDDVVATEALLEEWIFDKQKAEVIFVLEEHREVGFALFFHNFSTFFRQVRYLSGRFIRFAGIPRQGIWQKQCWYIWPTSP
jgi:hypothetical protein